MRGGCKKRDAKRNRLDRDGRGDESGSHGKGSHRKGRDERKGPVASSMVVADFEVLDETTLTVGNVEADGSAAGVGELDAEKRPVGDQIFFGRLAKKRVGVRLHAKKKKRRRRPFGVGRFSRRRPTNCIQAAREKGKNVFLGLWFLWRLKKKKREAGAQTRRERQRPTETGKQQQRRKKKSALHRPQWTAQKSSSIWGEMTVDEKRGEKQQDTRCALDEILDDDNVLGLVLSQVDRMTLVACKFVARRWNRVVEQNRVLRESRRSDIESDPERLSLRVTRAVLNCVGNVCPWDEGTCDEPTIEGPLDAPEWAKANGCACRYVKTDCRRNYMHTACGRASLSVVRWMGSMGGLDSAILQRSLATMAVEAGRLDVLDWLVDERGFKPDFRLFVEAAYEGRVGVSDWMVEQRCTRMNNEDRDEQEEMEKEFYIDGVDLRTYLVDNGQLDAIKWTHARGMQLTESTINHAAFWCNEPTFGWLWEQGCRPTDGAIEALFGSWEGRTTKEILADLTWMLDRGCPVSSTARSRAVRYCALDVVKLLFAHSPVEDRARWIQKATKHGKTATAAWLASQP